jgi:hypothetical protein
VRRSSIEARERASCVPPAALTRRAHLEPARTNRSLSSVERGGTNWHKTGWRAMARVLLAIR